MKFSIVIPVYNVAPFLPDAINSVRSQEYCNWELVIVDDGSTDGSTDILRYYSKIDSRIRCVYQPNQGVGIARNVALDMVSGDWILFLDADDVLRYDALEILSRAIGAHKQCSLFRFGMFSFRDGDDIVWPNAQGKEDCEMELSSFLPIDCVLWPFFAFCMSTTLVNSVRFRSYCVGEDRLFLSEVLSRADNIVRIPESLYAYRQRAGSAMHSAMSKRKLIDRVGYSLEWLGVLVSSNKQVSRDVFRLIVTSLTEGFVYDITKLQNSQHDAMWSLWYDCLRRLRQYRKWFPMWANFVMWVCEACRCHWIARFLCEVPHRIKLFGINRQNCIRMVSCLFKKCKDKEER